MSANLWRRDAISRIAASMGRDATGEMTSEIAGASPLHPIKRSISVSGHRTSISLEEAFWTRLKRMAQMRGQSVSATIADIDAGRGEANLSSAIRVAVLEYIDQ